MGGRGGVIDGTTNRSRQLAWFRVGVLTTCMIALSSVASYDVGVGAAAQNNTYPQKVGQWLVDAQGRVLVMHGVNLVHKTAPFYPDNFSAQDAAFLASEGLDVARIGFIWSAVEPEPGVYDDTYIEHVITLNDLLARYGIRTLIDFHQDSWSAKAGGDGAPAWASPSTSDLVDFQDFWNNTPVSDGVGLQVHFKNAWRHVVTMLDQSSGANNIVGFDPFNEPYAGIDSGCVPFTPCPLFEAGPLASFYRGVIAAIRSTGDQHVIFPEAIAQNGIFSPSLPAFADSETAFSFHYYCPLTQTAKSDQPYDGVCRPLEQWGVGNFVSYAHRLQVPAFVGEFSCNDADEDNAAMVDLLDQDFLSWTVWAYYSYAQDPANCPGQGLLLNDQLPGSLSNAKAEKLDALVVPYAEAIAGTPQLEQFDRTTMTLTMKYSAVPVPGTHLSPSAVTDFFVPSLDYPNGADVRVLNGQVVSRGEEAVGVVPSQLGDTVTVVISPAA
jgi:endoglycosylceramidase